MDIKNKYKQLKLCSVLCKTVCWNGGVSTCKVALDIHFKIWQGMVEGMQPVVLWGVMETKTLFRHTIHCLASLN